MTAALSLDPFDDSVVNFQRGLVNSFEASLETLPHNPVHNLIGGAMGAVTVSPRDPIFWSHHANRRPYVGGLGGRRWRPDDAATLGFVLVRLVQLRCGRVQDVALLDHLHQWAGLPVRGPDHAHGAAGGGGSGDGIGANDAGVFLVAARRR